MATLENSVSSVDLTAALGGAAPSASDIVYLNRGSDQYTTNMAFSNDLTLFHATNGWSGDAGHDGSRLELLSTAGVIKFEWAGRIINFRNRGTNAQVEVRPARAGRVQLHDNTVTLLIADSGTADVFDTCDVDNLRAGDVAQVLLRKHATTTTTAAHLRGRSTVRCERPLTNAYLYDQATLIVAENSAPTVQCDGGTVIFEGGGTPTLGNCGNCTLDFSRVRKAITVGGTPTFYSGVKIILPANKLITLPSITNVGRLHEIMVK